LVPVIGLVQVGDQALADRYTYLPLIGLFVAFAWGLGDLAARWPVLRAALVPAAAGAALPCARLTWLQVLRWHDSRTLWEQALRVTPDNYVARNNLGLVLLQEGASPLQAAEHLREAVRLRPNSPQAYLNLGTALDKLDQLDEAIDCY